MSDSTLNSALVKLGRKISNLETKVSKLQKQVTASENRNASNLASMDRRLKALEVRNTRLARPPAEG